MAAVAALRLSVGDSVVEGILVPFGPPADDYGTTFDESTDYCLDWLPERPLLLHHGLSPGGGVTPIGRITALIPTRAGLKMRAVLDKAGRLYERVKGDIQAGRLFLSSGAMAHLTDVGPGGRVRRWPIVEGSLTPTPSSPRAVITSAELRGHCRAAGITLDEAALLRREVLALERSVLDTQVAELRRWARSSGVLA